MEKLLEKIKENIDNLQAKVDSVVIDERDRVVSHVYNDTPLHELRSCSKLIVAYSIGILIDRGLLSLDTKIYDILTPLSNNILEDNIPKMREWSIRTLLTHTTGYGEMMLNEEWLETHDSNKVFDILFSTPIVNIVNKDYTYSNVEPYLCSVIYQEMFHESLEDFVKREIFEPLNIENYEWHKYNGYTLGATGLYLHYLDFHKIARLLMDKGYYEGVEIVPSGWIVDMTSSQVECPKYFKPTRVIPKYSAGYFTFISRDGIVFRDGSRGQYIICDYPNDRLVTIMATDSEMTKETEILRDLI